ncbi:ascorbate transporter, chloroplastic-like isoform X1 [Pyrus x bretschneideri]|uniref:ascorbate transporter, chloroplastic-like isoform X1 n=1 Tax=Pyrus x bretschneideri TaxID=225117 RepID=UPI00203099CA|nr:ascorbate transporter, chloroplastic-like isoform X1 [Pyrus x bretschneideri]
MAIGGLISNRNFGSFVGSGKACQTNHAIVHHKGKRLYYQGKTIYPTLRTSRASGSISGYSYSPYPRAIGSSDTNILKATCRVRDEGENPHLIFLQSAIRSQNIITKQILIGNRKRYLSSNHFFRSCLQSRKLDKLDYRKYHKYKHAKVNRTYAYYKSEDNDITESEVDSLTSIEGSSEAVLAGGNVRKLSSWWEIPRRWVIVLLCFTAFLLCNMDRVNMSIAILPMSHEFNWNNATVGLIQSSFFWGYLLTQILGGILADKIGGKRVLGFGVIWWSVATILTPIAAKISLPFLLIMRAFMGIGEGVAMPAMNNILSKWIPVSERSRALSLVYTGMYLGSVIGLAVSPILIQKFKWPSVFYSFGSLGCIWLALWLNKAYSTPKEDPELTTEEKELIMGGNISKEPVKVIPWKLILSKPPVWALIVCHFCHNWGTFILLTWMPTYYNQVLKFNLTESGLLCVLPWLTMAIFANIGGWIADTLVSKGFSVTTVRKIMQSIGFLGPAFFLTLLSRVKTPAMAVLCMACSQGSDAFSQSGLYSNHQDIGPRYAGVLLGLSNTAGVLAGVFGTAATGYILQRGSWDDVFKVSVVLYIMGTLIWNLFSTGEKIID